MSKFSKWCVAVSLAVVILSLPAYAEQLDIRYEMGRQVKLPEDQIDVGIAALTFAKEIYPEIDIAAYSRKIDALADQVRQFADGTQDPERRIRVMNTVLFRMQGFHYDRDPFSRNKLEYYFLNGILDTKQGICYTLPLLYVAVAQRVGYPVYPVMAPDHMFVRYSDPSFKEQNIEVTSGGKYFEDSWYIKDFSISKLGLKSGAYLKTLTYKEFVGQMLSASAFALGRNGNGGRAVQYLEVAVKLDPRCADCYNELKNGYMRWSEVTSGETAIRFKEKSQQSDVKAKELGFVDLPEISRGRELRGK